MSGPRAAPEDGLSWEIRAPTAAAVGAPFTAYYAPRGPEAEALSADPLASSTTGFAAAAARREGGGWAWTVVPLAEGRLEFVARWKRRGEALASPPAAIAVSVAEQPAAADIRDIKPPARALPALWPWLAAFLLGAAAWAALRRLRGRAAAGAAAAADAPRRPPEEEARAALDELAASGLWPRGEHAAYYLRLTAVLRAYLEARYGEPATAMTSAEVSRLLRGRAPGAVSSAARAALERADLVKFARIRPEPQEGPADLEAARRLVDETTPRPAEPAPAS